ncbi:MAG: adenylate/guanylate cyclase domain-containing protein [Longimicrobiales bacterium]|jgi:class 3 adenylate cyclase
MLRIRESFAAKLLAGLVVTMGLLLTVTFAAVRMETARQETRVSSQAAESAERQFALLEEIQRDQMDRLSASLVDGPRTRALVEEGAFDALAGDAVYQIDVAGLLGEIVVAFSDAEGVVGLTILADGRAEPGDALDVGPLATELVLGTDFELARYRAMGDRIYNIRIRVIETPSGVLLGTVAFALPFADEDVAQIGELLGVEACFVMEGRCLAGTPLARERLAAALASVSADAGVVRANAAGLDWYITAVPFVEDSPAQGTRVIAVPLNGIRAPFQRITWALVFGGGGALALSLLLGLGLSRGLTRPVLDLVRATGLVARGEYDTEVVITTRDEIGTLAASFNDMTRGLLLKERYHSVLNKVVSQDVAEELMKGNVELGGENREVTVLFADIRGFTSLTEGMDPQAVIGLLNECMERLSAVVDATGGVVDKYVGDELMAVFGAPISADDDALRAVRAAVAMRDAIEELNALRALRGDGPIGVGIGVSTGLAVAGNMGSSTRLNYTVLGDIVNLGSRLCSGAAAGEVLISELTYADAGELLVAESCGTRAFKGFQNEIEVFAVDSVRRAPQVAGVAAGSTLGALGLFFALVAGGVDSLAAQDWPTLADAGLAYISSDGSVQFDVSGQLDLELLSFTGHDAGLAYGKGTWLAPRVRLFGDLFLGESVYGLIEVRGDRGEAPTQGAEEVRLEQVFLRFSAGTAVSIQAGRFASPFGSYAARHLTDLDPFVRPPLAYDYRTVISRTIAPGAAAGLLTWQDRPEVFRAAGAPPVWNVPYQWGAMLQGSVLGVQYRLAAMNSAPSSEVEAWTWDADRMKDPSFVVGLQRSLTPEVTLDLSYNHGPYAEAALAVDDHTAYDQSVLEVATTFARGPLVARAQVLFDSWEVPNIGEKLVEIGYGVEAQLDVSAGFFFSGRIGVLDFRPMAGTSSDWDHDVARYEAGVGYRLARNAGLLGSFMHNATSVADPHDDLWSFRMWWRF